MLSYVFKYAGRFKKKTVSAMIVLTAGVLLSMVPYFLVYQLIEPLLEHRTLTASYAIVKVALFLLCLLAYRVLYCYGLKLSHEGAFNTLKNIRMYVQERIEKMPLGKIQDIGTGQLKKVFTDDIDGIELLLAHAVPEGFSNLMGAAVMMIAMFFVDIRMALLSVAALALSLIISFVMFGSCMKKMNEYYAASAKMNNTIIEYVNGMEVIKVFNRHEESFKKFKEDVLNYRNYTLDWYKMCWPFLAVTTSLLSCLTIFSLPAGVAFISNGSLTLSRFALIICLTISVGTPLLKIGSYGATLPQLQYKISALEKLTEGEALKTGKENFKGSDHTIRFNDVRFSYKDTEVVHGVSFEIKENSMTALVGESGGGKSTLAKLLVHFYDTNAGSITIGGQDITDMSLEALNNEISYVSQELFLFNTTIYENILIGKPDATREEVLAAANRAQCADFLEKLPMGIDSKVGDSGKMLSGGERQRIALARAILKNAPIVVLDEATAFIDPENEEKMNAAISQVIKDKTIIVIAHRLPSIVEADQIVVLNEGSVSGIGTHAELLSDNQEYRRLWNAQAKTGEWQIKEEA
ncbi:MAG: ABC transporter ATP-binding protein/permease [Lachnospiraceae bacterium]|nr:ABC transporter ATP-binding protein/permease [Lachnospiraceae bacterium]